MRHFRKISLAIHYWLLWLLIFQAARVAFILYNHHLSPGTSLSLLVQSSWYGLRMDMSMASYLLLPFCLGMIASLFFPFFSKDFFYRIYTVVLLIFVVTIVICDLPAYEAWGYRLDTTPLKYLNSPHEASASISHLPILKFIAGFMASVYLAFLLFKTVFSRIRNNENHISDKIREGSVLILFLALQILPIRGGWQLAPLNQSSVYFCQDNFANVSAIKIGRAHV